MRLRRRARWRSCRCAGLGLSERPAWLAAADGTPRALRRHGQRDTQPGQAPHGQAPRRARKPRGAAPHRDRGFPLGRRSDDRVPCRARCCGRDLPHAVVLTSRVEGDVRRQAWRAQCTGAPLTTIDLGPLRQKTLARWQRAISPVTKGWSSVVSREPRATHSFSISSCAMRRRVSDARVPGSIQSLVQARLDRLDPLDRAALQAASVLGQRFQSRSAAAICFSIPTTRPSGSCAAPDPPSIRFVPVFSRADPRCRLRRTSENPSSRLASQSGRMVRASDPVLRAEHLERAEDPEAPRRLSGGREAEISRALHYEHALTLAERGLILANATEDRHQLGLDSWRNAARAGPHPRRDGTLSARCLASTTTRSVALRP